jgi:hypothetical protein
MDDITELRRVIGGELADVHTCMPGTIVDYDGKFASVKPALSKSLANGEALDAPTIYRVPVCWPCGAGGKAMISVPLAAGDPVLLHFAERALEDWLSGTDGAPGDPRQFDLSDAFATPVCRPGVQVADTQNLVVRLDQASVTIAPDGTITITTNSTASITAPSGLTINADVAINGSVTVSGTIDAQGDVTGAGISLSTHTHPGVQSGGSNTGAPQ